jgi:hypothetical protein
MCDSDSQSSGQITNLFGNDGSRLENSIIFLPYLIISPIEVIVIIVILIKMVDSSILSGLLFVLISVPVQVVSGKLLDILRFANFV